MERKNRQFIAGLAAVLVAALPAPAQTQAPPLSTSADVVVSATKLPEDAADVPAAASVVSGAELRRSGAKTVAEAIQDVVGVDTANGSDGGSRLANIGLWGLKEFDALLVTVDGVPAGGPFNPSLSQIPVEDVDRIEIVKGPQGTLCGVSAFAGMIQVFTKKREGAGGSVSLGGGSFSEKRASVSYSFEPSRDVSLRLYGSLARSDGWQDRTDISDNRLSLTGEKRWGEAKLNLTLATYLNTNYFGSPQPSDGGAPVPGFESDRNYAVVGGRLDHRVYSLSSSLFVPLSSSLRVENTLGLTRDEQISVRSFITAFDAGTASATGTALKPVESSVYDDVRIVSDFALAGTHRLVGGAALTWGRTTATGKGFDFDLTIGPNPVVPGLDQIPAGDHRSYEDRRTFLGLYLNDEWTPTPRLTFTLGGRYDTTSESLSAVQQEVGTPTPDVASDSRSDGQLSGGLAALFRAVSSPVGPLDTANLYVSLKSNFKPAAPNLGEAEGLRILDPERARSGELGLKTRWLGKTLAFDVSWFHMSFENMVVSVAGPDGVPKLTNAGEERFQGTELDLSYRPPFAEGLSLAAGYAHHDATFVHFSFFTLEGELRVVDGKRLELVPRDLWNVRLGFARERGPGGFLAVRHQGIRPLNRRNRFYTDAFTEWDAGMTWDFAWGRLGVAGRNLGDNRQPVADSEIGDSQLYINPPRRFLAELTVRF